MSKNTNEYLDNIISGLKRKQKESKMQIKRCEEEIKDLEKYYTHLDELDLVSEINKRRGT